MENTAKGFMKVIEEKRVGECLSAGSVVIIPVIKIFISFCGKETLNGAYFSITPYAIVVVDASVERVLSFAGEDININKISKEVPGLTEKIKEVKAALSL